MSELLGKVEKAVEDAVESLEHKVADMFHVQPKPEDNYDASDDEVPDLEAVPKTLHRARPPLARRMTIEEEKDNHYFNVIAKRGMPCHAEMLKCAQSTIENMTNNSV
uniref:Protein Ycf2-like n=1 Tax=Panagrellus redivivus TaxID=6233 RepID=A0A7E4VWN0_PANRE